jgi:hypothetical protein
MERGVQGEGEAPMPKETAKQSMARPKAIKIIIQRSVIEGSQFYLEIRGPPDLRANNQLLVAFGSFSGWRCKPENFTTS